MPSLRRGASLGARVGITKLRPRATPSTAVTVEQPLRAESGTGTVHLETGSVEDGHRLRADTRVPLRPQAREVRMTLRHEREATGGQLALERSGAVDRRDVAARPDGAGLSVLS